MRAMAGESERLACRTVWSRTGVCLCQGKAANAIAEADECMNISCAWGRDAAVCMYTRRSRVQAAVDVSAQVP